MKLIRSHSDKIVVTGAAGFIGSGVVRFLNDAGYENLVLVDDLGKSEQWKNLLGKSFTQLISRHQLFDWLEREAASVAAFIHLGACADTLETDSDFLMENNFRYSVRLAEYALRHGCRFIYASSAATYGDGSLGFTDDHERLHELKPLNPYGFSKYCFDVWAKQNGLLDRLVGLKYFNVFGPNENHKGRMASMVYKMVPLVQQEGVLRLFKSTDPSRFQDGEQCRDFIYVKDVARITCSFLFNTLSGIFNLGSGQVTTWNQLAYAVFAALGRPPCIEYIPMPSDLAKQYQNFTLANMEKYLAQTGEKIVCQFSINDAVNDYIQHHLSVDRRW